MRSVRDLTFTASSLLKATCPQRTQLSALAKRTLLRRCVTKEIIVDVISVINPYSKYKTLCSFKPKHECYDVIIYCLSASCFVCICIKLKDT